jgi:hypothetical protein
MIMSPGVRKFALAVHLTLSVGWIGAVGAYIALDIATVVSENIQTLRTSYLGMDLISQYVIVPLAFASLLTGLIVSLGTKWGLFRHYWVLISFVLTIIATLVLFVERGTIGSLEAMATDPATSGDVLRAMPSTLPHSGGGTVVLLVVLVLNIYKPQGLTRYGWRKQQREPPHREERVEARAVTASRRSKTQRETIRMGNPSSYPDAEEDEAPENDRRVARGRRRWLIFLGIALAVAGMGLLLFLHLAGGGGPRIH